MTGQPIVVWASGHTPGDTDDNRLHCLWDHSTESTLRLSLLAYVERHGERLRDRYVRWVEDLAGTTCLDSSLVDQLMLDNGLSYWWMTRVAERSPWRSEAVATVLRLMALEEVLQERSPPTVSLIGADETLTRAIKGLCSEVGIHLEEGHTPKVSQQGQQKPARWYRHVGQTILHLGRYVWEHWTFRRLAKPSWNCEDHSAFFCSYFLNLDQDAGEIGRFRSGYWGAVPEILDEAERGHNWVHLYAGARSRPDTNQSIDLLQRFNDEPSRSDIHTFIEAYLSIGLLARVLWGWFRLLLMSTRVDTFQNHESSHGDSSWLRPVLADDFYVSLRGPDALWNLLMIEYFDRILAEMPTQETGYYLCENIAWERALVHAWRRHGHGRLVGVAHATIRFWDLRYQQDWRVWERRLEWGAPEPDHLAVNGPMAFQSLRGDEAPSGFLLHCEAVRYGRLVHRPDLRWSPPTDQRRLLVFCEWSSVGTSFVLSLLASALAEADRPIDVAVKPHPGHMPGDAELAAAGGRLVDGHVDDLLADCDLVLVSNATSTVLDVYIFGWPMVVSLSPSQLNLNDLRGDSDVEFISTSEELASFLSLEHPPPSPRLVRKYFDLDPELAAWRQILAQPDD